jgi:hypothetical protein
LKYTSPAADLEPQADLTSMFLQDEALEQIHEPVSDREAIL